MGRCSCTQIVETFKLCLTYIFSNVGLCMLVVGYCIAGAFLFRWLEKDYTPQFGVSHRRHINTELLAKQIVQQALTKLRERPDEEMDDVTFRAVVAVNHTIANAFVEFEESILPPSDQRWNLVSALFYCVTVITTIGYGHISPETFAGKMSTIFYAVLGIPLFLLTLTNLGDSMASAFRFAYIKACCCCVKKPKTRQVTLPRDAKKGGPLPYQPPIHYAPKRKKMLISPPISATLHRGNDLHVLMQTETVKRPSGGQTRRLYNCAPEELEARKLVAECSAYASSTIPGFASDPLDLMYDPHYLEKSRPDNSNRDYDLIDNAMTIEPPTPSSTCSPQSSPSSPLSRDAPGYLWSASRETTVLSVSCSGQGSSSSQTTRAESPSLISPNSSSSPRAESSVTWADDDPNMDIEGKPRRNPRKTVIVYNTMSGDALQQQSKLARRMAAVHRKKHLGHEIEESTMFVDPHTGQTVDSNIIGLPIRPIPPAPEPKDVRVPILIVLLFVACYVMVGALLFSWLEDWTLSDSAYFCFITLSTIGFGDFVPAHAMDELKSTLSQIKLFASSLYLLFGLAVLAMSFNLVQEEVVAKCKAFASYIGLIKEF